MQIASKSGMCQYSPKLFCWCVDKTLKYLDALPGDFNPQSFQKIQSENQILNIPLILYNLKEIMFLLHIGTACGYDELST
jgi:hypothetical protein